MQRCSNCIVCGVLMRRLLPLLALVLFAAPAWGQLQTIDFSGATLPGGVTLTRSSSATYTNISGVLSTATTNTARFNYNNGTLLGLLVEPAATNICLQSNAFTTTWSNSGYTINSGAFTSPDGTGDGWSIAGPLGSAITIALTFTPSSQYTMSLWQKSISGSFNNQSQLGGTNLLIGTVGATLTRSVGTALAGSSGSNLQIIAAQTPSATLGLFGCQVETGPTATSYIPTTTVAVTRSADVVTFTQTVGVNYYAFAYQDGSHQVVTAASMCITGTCTIPTNLNEPNMLTINGYAAFPNYTYYLSATGSDSNNGNSAGSPWLTPNHAVNCGDVILAAASSSYSPFVANFGTVTCAAGNNVAWLKCAVFDTCKISTGGQEAMLITTNYWGVQGWETTVSPSTYYACFAFSPYLSSATIHHVIFANDIANGCSGGGFSSYQNIAITSSTDYVAILGSIAYNATQGNGECYSGISIAGPQNFDTQPGTHNIIAGNFSWANVDPNPCGGVLSSDGEGIIEDTPSLFAYTGQTLIANNVLVGNGGYGIQAFDAISANQSVAPIFIRQNTIYGNKTQSVQTSFNCPEFQINSPTNPMKHIEFFLNLSVTASATGCGVPYNRYAYQVFGDTTDLGYGNMGYSAAGFNTSAFGTFVFSPNNVFGIDPAFANPVIPGAPSCGAFLSVPDCMATAIANFKPTNSAAKYYGYQTPTAATTGYDPLFPKWLCSVTNLPVGLVQMNCGAFHPSSTIGGNKKLL